MATSTRGTSADRRRQNRNVNLQWALLAMVIIIVVLAAFLLLDGGGATHGGTTHN